MNIIFFSRANGRAYNFNCSRWYHFGIIGICLGLLAIGLWASGYFFGQIYGSVSSNYVPAVAQWRQDFLEQRRQIETTREMTEAQIDALVQRLGSLQAYVNRLDALGHRVVKRAKLDEGEFDFSAEPGVGGPEQLEGCQPSSPTEIDVVLDDLMKQLDEREAQLRVLDHILMSRKLQNEIHPAGRPIRKGWISSYYGKRKDPFSGKTAFHHGMDFAGKEGSDIIAVAGGVVTWAGNRGRYGNLVEIDHGRNYVTRYGHNKEILVKVGETLKKGQVIAKMGSTGRSTGPHVHFEVLKKGKHVNPVKFINASNR